MDIIGRFYFKQTSNGNLIGEFSNNVGKKTFTESADIIEDDNEIFEDEAVDVFIGKYKSSWQEKGKPQFAELEISFKHEPAIYQLEWKRDNKEIFKGEGMLCDDILIGNYWGV